MSSTCQLPLTKRSYALVLDALPIIANGSKGEIMAVDRKRKIVRRQHSSNAENIQDRIDEAAEAIAKDKTKALEDLFESQAKQLKELESELSVEIHAKESYKKQLGVAQEARDLARNTLSRIETAQQSASPKNLASARGMLENAFYEGVSDMHQDAFPGSRMSNDDINHYTRRARIYADKIYRAALGETDG